MEVYVLEASRGRYEDYYSWIEGVYSKEKDAIVAKKSYDDSITVEPLKYSPEDLQRLANLENQIESDYDWDSVEPLTYPEEVEKFREWLNLQNEDYYPAKITKYELK